VPEPDVASQPTYHQVAADLRAAYDGSAQQRDRAEKTPWKLAERAAFLDRLSARRAVLARGDTAPPADTPDPDGSSTPAVLLLEVGAGAGQDSQFFAASGLSVVATDNSPGMVACCVARGLDARVADFLDLGLPPASFDAVYAMNCLLHVPNSDLAAVLLALRSVLRPGGLLYVGVWAGDGSEGPADRDWHVPARFFSRRTDEQLISAVSPLFEIIDFHVRDLGADRFQSMTLRRPVPAEGSDSQ
jgi:SAM-dependent methyltransferase